MSFDSNMVATALRLIKKRGQTVVYTRITAGGAYNPATGAPGAATQTAYTIKALAQDYTRMTDGFAFVAGLIQEGDKKITIAAAAIPFTPAPGDRIAFEGFTRTVQSVKSTSAGELTAVFECRVRS